LTVPALLLAPNPEQAGIMRRTTSYQIRVGGQSWREQAARASGSANCGISSEAEELVRLRRAFEPVNPV
jgi:hypothetical protein